MNSSTAYLTFFSRSFSYNEITDGILNVGDPFQLQLCVANFIWDIS